MNAKTLPASLAPVSPERGEARLAPGSALALLGHAATDAERYGILVDLWDSALAEARRSRVCDLCGQPVAARWLGELGGYYWCHRSGLLGCEMPLGAYAQVDGSAKPCAALAPASQFHRRLRGQRP